MPVENTLAADCCGETQPTNPKETVFRQRKTPGTFDLFSAKNPIPAEVEDSGDIKALFSKWNLVPFSGTSASSGHNLLIWYLMLAKLSPSHAACISKKLKYAVGGRAEIERTLDDEWNTGEESQPVSTLDAVAFRDSVKMFIDFDGGIRKLARRVGWTYEATGNAFVELCYTETLGIGRAFVKVHKATHCLYLNTKPGENKIVAISPKWESFYLDKKEPRYVPLYPKFVKENDGVLRTMFHLKNGDNEWYGRPESEGADLYKYFEVQQSLYLIKQAGANFTGQLIIEVEDDDPETNQAFDDASAKDAGFQSFGERFEQNYTAKANDPQTVLVTARPYGSRPMFVFQVSPNTNENWFKTMGEQAEQKILRQHSCTPRFMGFETAGGFSTDVFISDYVINMEPTIESLRGEVTGILNKILSVVWIDLLKKPELNDYSITFSPPIKSAVEKFKVGQPATL